MNNIMVGLIFGVYIAVITCIGLVGCATVAQHTSVQKVDIPVYVLPEQLPKVEIPSLPIESITDSTSDGEVVVAYVSTIKILKGYLEQLKIQLEALMVK